jgi:hypothetical protein
MKLLCIQPIGNFAQSAYGRVSRYAFGGGCSVARDGIAEGLDDFDFS